jgi:hypothetical protein
MYQLDNIAGEMELEFTVNTGSSDESDDLEWEIRNRRCFDRERCPY